MTQEPLATLHDARPERVMVIVAHPDDADFGPAGTVARWVRAGSVAHLVCCTRGDAGADEARTDPLALARTREAEQRAAARHVGYAEVTFLHCPTVRSPTTLRRASSWCGSSAASDPTRSWRRTPTVQCARGGHVQHTDHRAAAGRPALDAVYPAARNALAFPHLVIHEGLEPHAVRWMYLFWTERPDVWVDVTATLDTRLAALHEHASQIRDAEGFDDRIRAWAAEDAGPFGVDAVDAFRLLDLA
ncbi:MAG: PIG-L deacetylase family protein [Chloroflexota bacterium]